MEGPGTVYWEVDFQDARIWGSGINGCFDGSPKKVGLVIYNHTIGWKNATYSPCQSGYYMLPIPPIKGTRFHSIEGMRSTLQPLQRQEVAHCNELTKRLIALQKERDEMAIEVGKRGFRCRWFQCPSSWGFRKFRIKGDRMSGLFHPNI